MKEKELVPESFYEERKITPRWRRGVLPNAGIWLLDGRYHVAILGSPAHQKLVDDGALAVASLLFDGAHADRPVRGDLDLVAYPARPIPSLRAIESLGAPPASN